MSEQKKELPKAGEILGFYENPQKKCSFNHIGQHLTKKQAESLIALWDRAPELEKENQRLREENKDFELQNNVIAEIITALRKIPEVNQIIGDVIERIKQNK
ncbi:MAG: hypothetical protein ACR2NW_09270 [Thermodesulfobacteriota bacterium]